MTTLSSMISMPITSKANAIEYIVLPDDLRGAVKTTVRIRQIHDRGNSTYKSVGVLLKSILRTS
jgi:hypothetical protein